MDTFCIHNARKMRTNFSLVYISPCTFKCPIKITRQSSHRCAELPGNTLANTVATPPCRPPLPPPAPRNLPFATLLGSKETYLSLHNPNTYPQMCHVSNSSLSMQLYTSTDAVLFIAVRADISMTIGSSRSVIECRQRSTF